LRKFQSIDCGFQLIELSQFILFYNWFAYKTMSCLSKIKNDNTMILTLLLRAFKCEESLLSLTSFSKQERSRSLFLKLSFG